VRGKAADIAKNDCLREFEALRACVRAVKGK
jgi:hypothetical protein